MVVIYIFTLIWFNVSQLVILLILDCVSARMFTKNFFYYLDDEEGVTYSRHIVYCLCRINDN